MAQSHDMINLSPSKKVQALLAQFSDSDSEIEGRATFTKPLALTETQRQPEDHSESSDGDDEIRPHGRLAARLIGLTVEQGAAEARQADPNTNAMTTPKRTATLVEHQDTASGASAIRTGASPATPQASPLFFPSPNSKDHHSPQQDQITVRKQKSDVKNKPQFLALVEKHRKARIAREAAEVVKRATKNAETNSKTSAKARGSSPADDSAEDSTDGDEEAVKRIQSSLRPIRKASKRAVEEMNRETQRMSRNMQLAHQAQSKTKITKDSLLARFGFPVRVSPDTAKVQITRNSSASSSTRASDAESGGEHVTTPPTSPVRGIDDASIEADGFGAKDITHLLLNGQVTVEMHGAVASNDNGAHNDSRAETQCLNNTEPRALKHFHPDQNATSLNLAQHTTQNHQSTTLQQAVFPVHIQAPKNKWSRTAFTKSYNSDSDGEIEIVRERGLKRKYAAFESLPKRKSREKPSHLALRSLAHLVGGDDKKRSINAAELEANLRKRARTQAAEERRLKIQELRAKGIAVQTVEERERDQQEVEDLVERARQEAAQIQKREKELAKKDGTYVKDNLDDDDEDDEDESDDADYEEDLGSSQESDLDQQEEDDVERSAAFGDGLHDSTLQTDNNEENPDVKSANLVVNKIVPQVVKTLRQPRYSRIVIDDDDDEADDNNITDEARRSPGEPTSVRTPQTLTRSVRKTIPGLQMSDVLPMGLSQAFAATMAESQTQAVDVVDESLDCTLDLPSAMLASMPLLGRLDSMDLIADSQPSESQVQSLNIKLLSQSQPIPESPRDMGVGGTQHTPSHRPMDFDLTQDNGYILSPFTGNRFADTPSLKGPHSTVETVILPSREASPVLARRGRLQRGQVQPEQTFTAFQIMREAAKDRVKPEEYNKKKSEARNIVDDAAEESEDEYAGLGGVSDDSGDDEENDDDRQMIDEDTQVGHGDEAKLAGLFADRERQRDEKEVSKLLKDITTGALRRKRKTGDDLDLSDEEDMAARRQEAKRREFARMRRELLKDEAVGKIAEDSKKEAFLRSIEDRDVEDDEHNEFEQFENPTSAESHGQFPSQEVLIADSQRDPLNGADQQHRQPLDIAVESKLNRRRPGLRQEKGALNQKPATLAEIRDSVSFLIEEPESQAAMVDLGISDSDNEPEAYVDLDRHFREAEADENDLEQDLDDLAGFVVDDQATRKGSLDADLFKKPQLPHQERAPFTERRTKCTEVVDRLTLLRQASSSASSVTSTTSMSSKMAFFSSKNGAGFTGVPTLLHRATSNSSLGSMSGRESVSATGVVTSRTERGNAGNDKDFVRKGNGGRRNAVNYQAERKTLSEEKMYARAGQLKSSKAKKGQGFLGGLFRGDSWE